MDYLSDQSWMMANVMFCSSCQPDDRLLSVLSEYLSFPESVRSLLHALLYCSLSHASYKRADQAFQAELSLFTPFPQLFREDCFA